MRKGIIILIMKKKEHRKSFYGPAYFAGSFVLYCFSLMIKQ